MYESIKRLGMVQSGRLLPGWMVTSGLFHLVIGLCIALTAILVASDASPVSQNDLPDVVWLDEVPAQVSPASLLVKEKSSKGAASKIGTCPAAHSPGMPGGPMPLGQPRGTKSDDAPPVIVAKPEGPRFATPIGHGGGAEEPGSGSVGHSTAIGHGGGSDVGGSGDGSSGSTATGGDRLWTARWQILSKCVRSRYHGEITIKVGTRTCSYRDGVGWLDCHGALADDADVELFKFCH